MFPHILINCYKWISIDLTPNQRDFFILISYFIKYREKLTGVNTLLDKSSESILSVGEKFKSQVNKACSGTLVCVGQSNSKILCTLNVGMTIPWQRRGKSPNFPPWRYNYRQISMPK